MTISRSSTGCIFSSRSCFAVPSIVWTTSCVEISRERPRRIPPRSSPPRGSAKYAGPEPETAVIASSDVSGTRTTAPRCESASSARSRCSSPACAPAQRPAMPSWTVDGVFGIARTTGTRSASRLSIRDVGIAAATERTVCSGRISVPISPRRPSMSCGLTAMTTRRRAGGRVVVGQRCLDAVALAQLGDALGPTGSRGDLGRLAPARREQPGDQRLADASGAEDRDLPRVDHPRSVRPVRRRYAWTCGRAARDPCSPRARGRA